MGKDNKIMAAFCLTLLTQESSCVRGPLFLAQGRERSLGGRGLVYTLGQASFLSSVSLVSTHDYVNIAS